MDYKIFDSFKNKYTFFIVFNNANPVNFNLKDLTGAGRLDVCCRTINSSFLLSNNFRRNVIFLAYFKKINKALIIDGSKAKGINPDERSTAGFIRAIFDEKKFPGSTIINISFVELISQLSKRRFSIYVLHEKGEIHNIENISKSFFDSSIFIIGDNNGFTEKQLFILDSISKISIGYQSYLTSTVITIINFYYDLLFSE